VNFFVLRNPIKNRPVDNHRPVFMLAIIVFVLLQSLASSTHQVQAKSPVIPANITPTPENAISIPKSGEPVIIKPGNNARLVSPLKLKIATKPGDDGLVRIELIGHDERLIFRKLMEYREYIGKTLLIEQEIPFEIRADEPARLQVVLEDSKGKTVFLTSVDLTLLLVRGTENDGESPVNPRFKIVQPVPETSIAGDSLTVNGGIKPINDNPIVVEVIASDWHTLTSRIVPLNIPTDQTAFTLFDVKLPYKTSSKIPVTIRIRQESKTLINGTVLLWSEKVNLVP
jgi:hypothetical protein